MAKENVSDRLVVQVEKPAVKPRISRENLERFFRRPTREALQKRRKIQEQYLRIRQEEAADRKKEEPLLATMEVELGMRQSNKPVENDVLDDKERDALSAAIEGAGESDPDELRETFIYSLKGQNVFREQYAIWQEQYLANHSFQARMTLEDFVRERGIRFIKANRKLIVRSRTKGFMDVAGKGKYQSVEERRDASAKVYREMDMFIQANYDQLASFSSLDAQAQKRLFGRFRVRIENAAKQNGIDHLSPGQVEEFFKLLTGDLEYETIALQDYDCTYGVMMRSAGEEVGEEEWENMRRQALEKNAKGELKEYLQQQAQPLYTGPVVKNAAPEYSFSSVNDVAHASGVNLRPADPKEKDLYYIDFPTIKDEKYPFMMKVVYPKGSTDVNDARFVIQEPWSDKDAPEKGAPLHGKITRTFKPSEVPRAINALILDYVLNRGIVMTDQVNGEPGVNGIIEDDRMVFMAEKLFGFSLDEKRVLEPQINIFKRFLTVLLRDDQTALETRVKKITVKLNEDAFLPYFREVLMAPGSAAKTLDDVIEEAELRREGEIK
jgi:hypothetical protein